MDTFYLICFILGSLLLYSPPGPPSPTLPEVSVSIPALVAAACSQPIKSNAGGCGDRLQPRYPWAGAVWVFPLRRRARGDANLFGQCGLGQFGGTPG